RCAYEASREGTLERLVPVAGPLEWSASPPARSRLVEGYDSWAYAGVRSAGEPGTSWWGTVVAGGDAAVGVQALDAHRFATAVTSRPGREQLLVAVTCGATPPEAIVAGTWGYETLAPPGLGLPLEAGTTERTPPIALTAARDPLAVAGELAALAGKASGARRWTGAPIVGWESWYHYGLVVEPEHVLENARVLLERYGTRPGFDVIQLDDGWQTTYGAWWPNDRFPADLRELTDAVRALGGRPGLWLAPFMVQPGAPGLGTEQPGWMVRGDDGAPLLDRYGRLGLDASNPAVVDWLRDLGRQVRAWGFEMVKLDFLYLGAVEGGRHDARSTGTAALRRGLGAMAEALGDDVYVLGCGMPLLPAVGVCHGNRVGHDLAVPVLLREFGQPLQDGWTGFHGIRPQARNVAARFALHRRWFEADPDVVMAWDGETDGYSVEEARTLATVAALCGGPFLLADELAALPQPARAVLEQPGLLDLVGGDGFRPVDLFARVDRPETEHFFTQGEPPSVWRAERGGRPVAALFNWADAPSSRPVPDGFAGSSELWTGDDVEGPTIEIPAHAVRVLRA
ncbi:MAG TPA: glycoside hydrolase family 36 protein, partial [Acidimicrobiia bacterium]